MKLKKITCLLKSFTILSTFVTTFFCFWIIPIAKKIAIEEYPELCIIPFLQDMSKHFSWK